MATVVPSPAPTEAQVMAGSSPLATRYQTRAEVTFHDGRGVGGRITRLELVAVTQAGDSDVRRVNVDLILPPRGAVKWRIDHALVGVPARPPVRLRIVATGVDGQDGPLTIPAVEVPLQITTPPMAAAPDAIFTGAGDIAQCGAPHTAEATARILDRTPGSVFTLGDYAYPASTADNFLNCYDPTWGRHRSRTFAAPGNHEWEVGGGAPYFAYFGGAAAPSGGYYSFNLGAWHILSLNSNIAARPASAQYAWVESDLAANPAACSLAYWHHPVFNSGRHGNNAQMKEMWRLLQSAGVDVVLAAHDHHYERFAPQDADGRPDPLGIRQFIVGTGGGPFYNVMTTAGNSEVHNSQTHGVLKLTLRAGAYDWEFIPVEGQTFSDAGTNACH
jgi:hypothetical protein